MSQIHPILNFAFGFSIIVLLIAALNIELSWTDFYIVLVTLLLLSAMYRVYIFQVPPQGVVIGVDGNQNIIDIANLVESGRTYSIDNYFYSRAPLYFILGAFLVSVLDISTKWAMGAYPLLMGIIPPLVAVLLSRSLSLKREHQIVAGGLTALGATSVNYGFASIPESLALMILLTLLLSIIGYQKQNSPTGLLIVSIIFISSLVFTHKLPLVFLGVLFCISWFLKIYSENSAILKIKKDNFEKLEYAIQLVIILALTIGMTVTLYHIGGLYFIPFVLLIIGGASRVNSKASSKKPPEINNSGLYFSIICFVLAFLLFAYIAPKFFSGSIVQILLSFLSPTRAPITGNPINSEFVSAPKPPFLIDLLFTKSGLVHAFALILIPPSVIGGLHILRQKPEKPATHIITGGVVTTIGLLLFGFINSSSVSYLRFLMLGEALMMVSSTTVIAGVNPTGKVNSVLDRSHLIKVKKILPILVILIIVIFQLSATISAPDSRKGHEFYVSGEEVTAKQWGYNYIPSNIKTDWYYSIITFPFVDSHQTVFNAFHPDDLLLAQLHNRDYEYLAIRSKPVLRTGGGIFKLEWDPQGAVNDRYNRVYTSGKVGFYQKSTTRPHS